MEATLSPSRSSSDRSPPDSTPLFEVSDLNVGFDTPDGAVLAVRGIHLALHAGETLAVVGESGSGKSQTMMAAMGLLAKNGRATGSVRYRGREILGLKAAALNEVRGAKIGMIFQEPMTSLDPLYTIGNQIAEPLTRHLRLSGRAARQRAVELLTLVGIPDPARRLDAYPHELSGGQRQRVMIAMALAAEPDVLIADEPTTALDVTVQAQIIDLLRTLQRRFGMGIVFITHDLGLARHFADRVAVMRHGLVVEEGPASEVLTAPRAEYTRMLLAAEPTGTKAPPPPDAPIVLEAQRLNVTFRIGGGLFAGPPLVIHAVNNVSVTLREGQTIGIVGESGSGKSTLGRALIRLIEAQGDIRLFGEPVNAIDAQSLRALRRQVQIVFQDPFGSLSPRMTVGEIITEGLRVHAPELDRRARERRAVEALEDVSLDPALRNRYPHEFSGGQRQRIAIARAVILKPRVLVLDEPTSALDRSVQKDIVDLLRRLQGAHRLSYLFISHDLSVVRALSDWIMVMRAGQLVEAGPTDEVFRAPAAAYTRELIAAAFGLDEAHAPAAARA
ncbi:oligopeptide transport system ATP-binding protein [Angulomicrobium tetraedrale]|uniref:Oligopeptide transport system ATP-binding protein n=1 Tax=Ancylobacter tetraedralis TaxID=217068 RepID=A0A839ZGM5_9HYPH|nr:ABC transporter ATP-binding protein [Ancylobacter tetraedralis]MBB3773705.1 oligopeptide transport system ATP-binding protein [Ancylobacter tetraedralis]